MSPTLEDLVRLRPDFRLIERGRTILVAVWTFRGEQHEFVAHRDAKDVLLAACHRHITRADVFARELQEFVGPPRPSPHRWEPLT